MLLKPSIDLLKTKVDSKYTLTVMAAKRARDLIDGKPALEATDEIKPLTIATEEIADDMISYKRVAAPEPEDYPEEPADGILADDAADYTEDDSPADSDEEDSEDDVLESEEPEELEEL